MIHRVLSYECNVYVQYGVMETELIAGKNRTRRTDDPQPVNAQEGR